MNDLNFGCPGSPQTNFPPFPDGVLSPVAKQGSFGERSVTDFTEDLNADSVRNFFTLMNDIREAGMSSEDSDISSSGLSQKSDPLDNWDNWEPMQDKVDEPAPSMPNLQLPSLPPTHNLDLSPQGVQQNAMATNLPLQQQAFPANLPSFSLGVSPVKANVATRRKKSPPRDSIKDATKTSQSDNIKKQGQKAKKVKQDETAAKIAELNKKVAEQAATIVALRTRNLELTFLDAQRQAEIRQLKDKTTDFLA